MVNGAKVLLDRLRHHGTGTVFGYPGASVLQIYDELPGSGIRHILVRHEQAAAHAADGYARASGNPGICLATSGPGACNLVTGIATAYADSVPVIAITGQVPTALLGTSAFQEADIIGITRPVTKRNFPVREGAELPAIIDEAFDVATSGRPGPVLVDIPKDITSGEIPEKRFCREYRKKTGSPSFRNLPAQLISKAAKKISQAENPVIYAGGGAIASGASDQIRVLADSACIPVVMSLLGLGLMPADHPLNLGMVGMHGTVAANYAVSECDLLIAVGARFSDRVRGTSGRFAPNATVIQIDIDPGEIGKNHTVDIPIAGDARQVLLQIVRILKRRENPCPWKKQVAFWKQVFSPAVPDDGNLYPQTVIRALSAKLKDDGIIVTEVGQHQMWTAQHFAFSRPRSFLTSGGLGTMGFGLPAAMGAHYARPEQDICVIAGDGSIQMNIQELATIAENQIPVRICILNNQYLGMVRQWQELFYDRHYSCTALPPIDFAGIAKAYGIEATRVFSPDEVLPSIQDALDTDGPHLIDFRIEREENVFPMVRAGSENHEMILTKP
jgi:acetolactate synthase-1/2/3 large subunit